MSLPFQPASVALLAKLNVESTSFLAAIPLHQRPEYTTALLYLTECTEAAEELSIHLYIQNALDACDCLCEVGAWELLRQLLLTPLHPTQPHTLDQMLNDWRFAEAQFTLYKRLLGKFERRLDAILLRGLGDASFHRVLENHSIQTYFEQSRALFLAEGALVEAAQLLHRLGIFALHAEGDLPKAEIYLQQALDEAQRCEDDKSVFHILHDLAQLAVQRGTYNAARHYLTQCLDFQLRKATVDVGLPDWVYLSLGRCCRYQEAYQDAAVYLRQSLRLLRQQEQLGGILWALMEWSSLLVAQARYNAARALLRYLLSKEDLTRPGPLAAWVYHLSGHIDLKAKDYVQACGFFHKALRIQQALGHQVGMIYAMNGIVSALVQIGHFTMGACLLGAVEKLCKQQQLIFAPLDRIDAEASLARLEQLDDQTAWRTAWAEGQTLSLEQAVMKALAMQQLETDCR